MKKLIFVFTIVIELFANNVYMVNMPNHYEYRSFLYLPHNSTSVHTIDKHNSNLNQYYTTVNNRYNNNYGNTGLYRKGDDGTVFLYNNPTDSTLDIINNDGWFESSYTSFINLSNFDDVVNYPILLESESGIQNDSNYRSLTFYPSQDNWGYFKDTNVRYKESQTCSNTSWKPNYMGECMPECPVNLYDELISTSGSCTYLLEWWDGDHIIKLPKYMYKEFYGLYDMLDYGDETTPEMINDYYSLSPLEFSSKYNHSEVGNLLNYNISDNEVVWNYDTSQHIPNFDLNLEDFFNPYYSDISTFFYDKDGNVTELVHDISSLDYEDGSVFGTKKDVMCIIASDTARFYKQMNYTYDETSTIYDGLPYEYELIYRNCFRQAYDAFESDEEFDINSDHITDKQRENAILIDMDNLDNLSLNDGMATSSQLTSPTPSDNIDLSEHENTTTQNTSSQLNTTNNITHSNNEIANDSVGNDISSYDDFVGSTTSTTTVTTSSGDNITITNDNTGTVSAINHLGQQIVNATNEQTQNFTNQIQNQTSNLTSQIQNQTQNITNSIDTQTQNLTSQINNQTQNITNSIDNQTSNLTSQIENQTSNLTGSIDNQTKNLTNQIKSSTSSITSELKTGFNRTVNKLDELINKIQANNSSTDLSPVIDAVNSGSQGIISELQGIKQDTSQISSNTSETNNKLDTLISNINSNHESINGHLSSISDFTNDFNNMGEDGHNIDDGYSQVGDFISNTQSSYSNIKNSFDNVENLLNGNYSLTLPTSYDVGSCLSVNVFGQTLDFNFLPQLQSFQNVFTIFFQILFLVVIVRMFIFGFTIIKLR